MTENDQRSRATAILTNWLQGDFISRFSIGNTFDLCIEGGYLVAQNVLSEDEYLLNQWYSHNYPSYGNCIDKEHISKATILAAHLRKLITAVELDDACNLILSFEGDTRLILPTDTDIVDWQWALNKTGGCPYTECIVGCFNAGEIVISEDKE